MVENVFEIIYDLCVPFKRIIHGENKIRTLILYKGTYIQLYPGALLYHSVGMNTHPSCKEAELGVSKQHEAENTQEFHVVYQFYSPLQTSASPAVLWWSVGSLSISSCCLGISCLSFRLPYWLLEGV